MPQYRSPAALTELSQAHQQAWSQKVSRLFDQGRQRAESHAPGSGAWFFNPVSEASTGGMAEANITWTAFPRLVAQQSANDEVRWRSADASRDRQDEYCEWSVRRDNSDKVEAVIFTTETTEYYDFLAANDRQLLLRLYRTHVSADVAEEEIIRNGQYVPANVWNYRTDGPIMHMAQGNNTLGAAVSLAADATWPRVDGANRPIVDEQALIACALYGVAGRHSDPHIGAQINALVRAGHEVSLADPPGLYVHDIDWSGWEVPDGTDPSSYLRDERSTSGFLQRAVYAVPGGKGFKVGDIKIDGRPIRYGGQIADRIRIRLRGIARPAAAAAPALECVAAFAPPASDSTGLPTRY